MSDALGVFMTPLAVAGIRCQPHVLHRFEFLNTCGLWNSAQFMVGVIFSLLPSLMTVSNLPS